MISKTRFVRSALPSRVCTRVFSDSTTGGEVVSPIKKYNKKKGVISEDRIKRDFTFAENPFPNAFVHRTAAMENGAHQYFLLPPNVKLIDALHTPELGIASLIAHRSIIFGARLHPLAKEQNPDCTIANVCPPLLEAACRDAGEEGFQLQAISTLYGLCDWVVECLEERQSSEVLHKMKQGEIILAKGSTGEGITADAQLQSVCSIATRTPRPGHSVVGKKTFAMGEDAWKALAKEFVMKQPTDECMLYQKAGAQLVEIEHLADTNPKYIASAGGAMGRFFFL